jgi:hypothetical protein
MVTHRFPLGSVVEAIDTVTNREASKVAVLPGGSSWPVPTRKLPSGVAAGERSRRRP